MGHSQGIENTLAPLFLSRWTLQNKEVLTEETAAVIYGTI